MKRLHVHVSVDDLAGSIRFYSALFGSEPTVAKPDYAKWMLDDPHVNFAISARGGKAGVDHLGIQVETPEELKEVYGRLQQARTACAGRRRGNLLLRQVRESVDLRPARAVVGVVPDDRRKHDLRRR